jgi:indolepyruvate ferredoxin oxidoreductase alpha subunit
MKKMGDMLLRREPFSEIVMGNTAIVRAMVEAGTRVVSSYPGSPTPEIASAIQSIPGADRPFYFEFSTNEKVATELAYGAAVNGHLSTVFFKSVGLNVAADTFVQLSLMNIIGGMVVVLGDDPGANSSQNEQDNRHYAMMSYTPVLEPADPAEVYHFYLEAARLSRQHRMPVILRMTTHVCHAKERIAFGPWNPVQTDDTPRFDPANGPYIPITTLAIDRKRTALARLEQVRAHAEATELTRQVDAGNNKRGVITMGLPFLSLMETLEGVAGQPDILKLAYVHPLPREQILRFLSSHEEVKILEELDDLVENQAKALAFDARLPVKIIGKTDVEDWIGEYTPDKVRQVLSAAWPDMIAPPRAPAADPAPPRPAQMCPGCGHRSAFHAIKQALSPTDITVADIGCHTLGFLAALPDGPTAHVHGSIDGHGQRSAPVQHQPQGGGLHGRFDLLSCRPARHRQCHLQPAPHHPDSHGKRHNGHDRPPGPRGQREKLQRCDRSDSRPAGAGRSGGQTHLRGGHLPAEKADRAGHRSRRHRRIQRGDRPASLHAQVHPGTAEKPRLPPKTGGDRPGHLPNGFTPASKPSAAPPSPGMPAGNVSINTDLCIGDGSCIQTCPTKAILPAGKPRRGGAA